MGEVHGSEDSIARTIAALARSTASNRSGACGPNEINFACRRARILASGSVPGWVRAAWKADPKGFMDEIYRRWDTFSPAD
jgi:hypothetical protein